MPTSLHGLRFTVHSPSQIHSLCTIFASTSQCMRLFQAPFGICLGSPFAACLSVHGLHFTVYTPSKFDQKFSNAFFLVRKNPSKSLVSGRKKLRVAPLQNEIVLNNLYCSIQIYYPRNVSELIRRGVIYYAGNFLPPNYFC